MSETTTKEVAPKPKKYCSQCGQKTFRPHRSVKELLWEFVENWFGYDSKAYKTAAALAKPAALSLDYFRNSHHNNHYVTPIRLYIFLSIIFFLLTSFGGFSLTEMEIDVKTALDDKEVQQEIEAIQKEKNLTPEQLEAVDHVAINDTTVIFGGGCDHTQDIIQLWPQWLDNYFDKKTAAVCDAYDDIQYLPEEKQTKAKINFWLSLGQSAIEALPQTFLFTMPLLAVILQLLYFMKRHLYVEHLVLLLHSHSYMFAIILLYLGWYQLQKVFSWLSYVPLGSILLIWVVIYLFLSMKRFYGQGFWPTSLKFIVFSIVYLIVFAFITVFAMMAALFSV
ncbi:DUF3667 domain-containing protein [Kangiella sediminilitoris]|uniref:DUF3667 domain-containing protein n=1 Tax=Kangiella sediminilitoris TaxID=1144748 RepID=A0A1B3B891_9GAMM|nr:DUF3667 domain-containing protein [Kangiella sediminilitoris]AOE48995.1 hypothetical protein KS2013_267 [Kangiella sediminilitoris]